MLGIGNSQQLVHATCVAFGSVEGWQAAVPPAALLRGAAGVGKSDLALRLIASAPVVPGWPIGPALLVSDDQVVIRRDGGRLLARAPIELTELMEVRGCGPIRLPSDMVIAEAQVVCLIDLVGPGVELERLPARETRGLIGFHLPRWRLTAWEMSAPEKLRLALGLATGAIADAMNPRPPEPGRQPKRPGPGRGS